MSTDLSIVDFIEARIADEEQIATALRDEFAADGTARWQIVSDRPGIVDLLSVHYVAFDHARVLREVAAKRQILAEHRRVDSRPDWRLGMEEPACYGCGASFQEEYMVDDVNDCPVLRALASVWAGHKSFRAEWSVTE